MTTEYTTVSFPKPLLATISKIVKEIGYWPSTAAFVREACVEKLFLVYKYEKGEGE